MKDLSATDRCVKCGLCLPHCPTFALTGNEADSPRGRISLMQAIELPDPQWSPGLFRHLDQCLHCGACEAMCPSGVPFGRLMDHARSAIEPHRQRPLPGRVLRRMGLWLIESPGRIGSLAMPLKIYQRLGLQWLIDKTPALPAGVKRWNRFIPPPGCGTRRAVNATIKQRGAVNLFQGCVGGLFDQRTLSAARDLLAQLGYKVNTPRQQACCGALHQHNGELHRAARLADANLQGFAADDNPILVTASGCAAHLAAYAALYADQPAGRLGRRVDEILHFLATQDLGNTRFSPYPERVAVYTPCTHRNILKQEQDILAVLSWIPDLDVVQINPAGGCCGAAGSYMLNQATLSDRLSAPLLEEIARSGARLVLTTNIGCAIQLKAGLTARAAEIEVLHPVTLLEQQLIVQDERQ